MRDDETATGPDAWAPWLRRLSAARRRRNDLIHDWQENVDRRRGAIDETTRTQPSTATRTRVTVNQDWPLTKAKIAQLYSQTPEVRLTPRDETFRPAVPIFSRELNDTISEASVGSTIEECLADVVNASGISGVLVSCEKRTELRDVPLVDPATLPPDIQQAVMTGAVKIPMEQVDHPVDVMHLAERISPADLLIPSDFTSSNYDKARWLGHDGRMTWPQALNAFKPSEPAEDGTVGQRGLTEDDKDHVLGRDRRASGVDNTLSTDTTKFRDTEVVNYTEVFYWRHFYHADETSFKALQRLVFVEGLDEPVVNEPYKGQQRDEQSGRMVGVTKNPIRVLTLTYISDDGLPPSDSSISRRTVEELEQSRDQMVEQRRHSIPWRWGDSNRISPAMRSKIDQGIYQDFIWTNGPGDRAIGEVSRASFPNEKWEFDNKIKNDLTELWQVGTNQAGAFAQGERSAREAGIIERNFQRRVGQEQDKVTKFFMGIAECLAGHLALYGTFDLPDELGPQRAMLANAFTYSVRVDSTVRLDAGQRIEQLKEFFNLWAQSGYLNVKAIAEEWAELIALDPAKALTDPQPKPPEPVKVSISKAEDLLSTMFVAMLVRTQQAPTPEDLAAAIKLQQAAMAGMAPPVPPQLPPGGPPTEVATPGIRNANFETAPRIERRAEDGGA